MHRHPLGGVKRFTKIAKRAYLNSNSVFAFHRSHVDKANFYPPKDDVVSWTIHIYSLVANASSCDIALVEASRMRYFGTEPNSYTLVCLIKASMKLEWISYGKQLHGYILRSGFNSNVYIGSALITLYSKLEFLSNARQVFDEITHPNIVAWNALIQGYIQSGQFEVATSIVLELDRSDTMLDSFTFTAALTACSHLGISGFGQTIHSRIMKLGLEGNVVVLNCLIDMYGKCEFVDEAVQVFHEIVNKDSVSWNSVIRATAVNQRLEASYNFLTQMPSPDTISYNEMIHGMTLFGNMEDAVRLLCQLPKPSSSSWNSIIAGYVKWDQAFQALEFFAKMHSEKDVEPDEFTYSTTLKGVANASALIWGRLIHCCTIKSGLDTCVIVGSALIDMYSKCGQVNSAEMVFSLLPRRNLVSWNALLAGYAHNGKACEVLKQFEQLKYTAPGIEPNEITFLSVLTACAQGGDLEGQVQLARQYFESMIKEYRIKPTMEHCTCMVHLLGRSGGVRSAKEMIEELGFGSCGSVWRAFFVACCKYGDIKIAEVAAAKVIELEGSDDEFVHVQLSNLYASHGRWKDASVVRRVMKERGLKKEAGLSWIELENVAFVSSTDNLYF